MENIDNLRASIDNNTNLSNEFKTNLKTLTDTLVTVLPNYDYSNYGNVLSNLKIEQSNIPSYSMYDVSANTLKLNIDLINEDRVDAQHLILNELILIGSGCYKNNPVFMGINKGTTEMISSLINSDDSMKKLNVIPYQNVRVLSKVVGSDVLLNSFMKQDYTELIMELEKKGLSNEESVKLINNFNIDNTLSDNELVMMNIYKNSNPTKEEYNSFKEYLVVDKKELMSIYPHYDFTSLNSFESLKNEVNKPLNVVITNEYTK